MAGSYWWFSRGDTGIESDGTDRVAVSQLDPQEVARGQAIYEANCASCHGPDGKGSANWQEQNPDGTYRPPPHDSTGHTWHHGDGLLYRTIHDGGAFYETPGFKSAMPAFGNRLANEEIVAVITYLKSLWGLEERTFQAEVSLNDPFPQQALGQRD